MAKKIEGAAIDHNGWIEFDQAPDEPGPWQKATLVIGDERVYTASDVRAMLEAVKSIVDTSPAQSASSLIDTYLLKWHGITLDPA